MVKAAIYARQSSGDEIESASVKEQIEICKAIAKKTGYEVIAVEEDKNISGRTYPKTKSAVEFSKTDIVYQNYIKSSNDSRRKKYREGLGRIFDKLSQIDILIVYDETRLMRPLTNSFLESYVKQNLVANGVKLQTKEKIIEFEDFTANLVNSLESRINDNQIQLNKKKSITALKRLQDDGYVIHGTRCLGFAPCGRQKVKIVSAEMKVVKIIFESMAKGKPLIEILREINALPCIKRKYYFSDIYKICNRLCYCGLTKNSKGEIIESKVYPKVIKFELFKKIQERLSDKKHRNYDKKTIHPLSSLVYCGYCGKKMSIGKSNPFPNSNEKEPIFYYECMADYQHRRISKYCQLSTIREYYQTSDKCGLKEAVLPLLINEIEIEIEEEKNNKIDKDSLYLELDKIGKLEKILDRKLVQGEITESEYDNRFDEYKNKKKEIQSKLLSSTSEGKSTKKALNILMLWISSMNKIRDDVYKYLAIKYIEKIIVFNENIIVKMKSGLEVKIERIRIKNTRSLPCYSLNKSAEKFELVYFYKTAKEEPIEHTIAETDKIKIITIGRNPKPYEYLRKRNQRKRLSESKKNQTITELEKAEQ